MAGNEYSLMKRQIVIKLFGEEIVNVLIDETESEPEETEELESNGSNNIETAISSLGTIGFGTPWSVEYWDDED